MSLPFSVSVSDGKFNVDWSLSFSLPFALTTAAAILIGLVLASLLIVAMLPRVESGGPEREVPGWLSNILGDLPLPLAVLASLIWLSLMLVLLWGAFWAIAQVILPASLTDGSKSDERDFIAALLRKPESAGVDLRWYLLTLTAMIGALGAVVALPFTLVRMRYNRRQTETQEESLFNDKINAAAEDLGRQRQVTKEVTLPDGTTELRDVWEDDLVTRAAAIDRLEGLVEERRDAAPRVARMLSVYVRELSAEHPAQDSLWYQFHQFLAGVDAGIEPEEPHLDVHRDEVTVDALQDWARGLEPVRSDMEKAAQTLGRLKLIKGVVAMDVPIDLRGANLQGYDLQSLCFDKARMQGARMEGADLSWALFDEQTNFTAAVIQYAAVKSGNYESVNLDQHQVNSLFGDGSVKLPAGLTRPDYWPEEDLGWPEFESRWRAWQAEQGYTPP